jgi:O-antigen/teichoic acid export membrane protein
MHLAGLLEITLRAVASLAVIAVVISGGSLVMALVPLPIVTGVQLLIAYWLVSRRYGRPMLIASWTSLANTVREAFPYALSELLLRLSTRMDVIILGLFLGAASAGIYNVSYRVIFLLLFIPQFAAVALFPVASRLYTHSMSELKALYDKSLRLIVLIGLPVASGVWLVAPELIDLVFGGKFAESVLILRLLCGVLFLNFLSRIMGVFLMACDRQVQRTKSQATAAWVNVLGNLLLIPALGVKGAAVATLISEVVRVVLFGSRLKEVLGWPRVTSRLAISSFGVASFCVPFSLLPWMSMGVVIPISMLVYTGILVLFKDIRVNECRGLLSMLKKESVSLTSSGQQMYFEESQQLHIK